MTDLKKTILKGMTIDELKEYFLSIDEPKYRAEQLFNWMYNHHSLDFNEMENLPKSLREKLNNTSELKALTPLQQIKSEETGTVKFVFSTSEENKIESVIIPDDKRTTLCVSTQVGCPLDCQFCATGLMGYKKNLTAGEIFDQFLLASTLYKVNPISNIVYMGMGEPLLNYENTLKSLSIFSNELTKGISLKKITLSTAGIAPKILELAESGLKPKLALSLHSCFEETRSKIMPISKKYSLKECIDAVKYYSKKTDTRITFEYILFKDINDRPEDLKALIKLGKSIPSKINVIPFNSLQHMNPQGFSAELKPTPRNKIEEFVQKLRDNDLTVMVRYTQGEDIAAACGQLAIKFK